MSLLSFFLLSFVYGPVIAVKVTTPATVVAGQSALVQWDLDIQDGGGIYDHLVFILRWPGSLEPPVLTRIDCKGQSTGETDVTFPQMSPSLNPYHVEALYPDENGKVVGIGPRIQLSASSLSKTVQTTSQTFSVTKTSTSQVSSVTEGSSSTSQLSSVTEGSSSTSQLSSVTEGSSSTSSGDRSTTTWTTTSATTMASSSSVKSAPLNTGVQTVGNQQYPTETPTALSTSGLQENGEKTKIIIILCSVLGSVFVASTVIFLVYRRYKRYSRELLLTRPRPLSLSVNTPVVTNNNHSILELQPIPPPTRARVRSKVPTFVTTGSSSEVARLRAEIRKWQRQIESYRSAMQPPAYDALP